MTHAEYTAYETAVADFFAAEEISGIAGHVDAEEYFSWTPCDCCRRPLGGTRHDVYGYTAGFPGHSDYAICSDCRYYAAYGRLDDLTMLEMTPAVPA